MFPYGQPPITPPDPDPDVNKTDPPKREPTPWLPWEKKVWTYTALLAFILLYSIMVGRAANEDTPRPSTCTTTRQAVDSGHDCPETTTTTGR